jgi:hypothetical protein
LCCRVYNHTTYNASIRIRIGKCDIAGADEEAGPNEHQQVVSPPGLSEYGSKVDKSSIVEELE